MASVERQYRRDDYSQLKDLRISLDREGVGEMAGEEEGRGTGGFCLCFWLYLSSSARPSSVILKQITSESIDEVPFITLSEENKLMLLPLMSVHKEAPSPESSNPWSDIPHAAAEVEYSLEKWIHVACQVARKYIRLHVNGKLVCEKHLSFLSSEHYQDDIKKITLVGNDGNLGGYVYRLQVLPIAASITEQFVKSPPVKLSLDSSCIGDGVEDGGDGVWSVVGGKASCRRNFSLEVVLLDAFGRSVYKEMEIVASLLYADNGAYVEKTRDDAEAPLLMSCDGLEYPSTDRPVMLLRGRATFKLKISQLSSKCDNRLFRVCIYTLNGQRYPFLEAYSRPIRCISRNRTNRTLEIGKRLTSRTTFADEIDTVKGSDGTQVINDSYVNGHFRVSNQKMPKCSPSENHHKVKNDRSLRAANGIVEKKSLKTSLQAKTAYSEGADSAPSDSESTDAKDSESKWNAKAIISDVMIFRYCLEDSYERSMLLKELVASASDEDITNFAEQVCLYSGCSHHRNQILISKRLLQEATETWNSIAKDKQRVVWVDFVPEISKKFMSIANSVSRALSGQDLDVLRGISGCGDDLSRADFDRMWYWLFPVAFSLSKDQINRMWQCTEIKWIEGFITREEAETALKDHGGLQKAGTFILRFPTSRSWPHPDAGSLVATYVGTDSLIHHKLLSIDHRYRGSRLLPDLLLEEPDLSQLGRVARQTHGACTN